MSFGPEKFLMGYDYPLHITPEQAPQVFRFAERYAAHVLADAIEALRAMKSGLDGAARRNATIENCVSRLRDMKEKP